MFKKSVRYKMNQLINKEIDYAEFRQDRRFMLPWVKSHSYVTSSQQERWASHKQSENELSSSLLHIVRRHTWIQRQGAQGREQWRAECTKVIDLRRRNGTKRCCNCSSSAQSLNQPYMIGSTNLTSKKKKLVWRIDLIKNVTDGLMMSVMWQTKLQMQKFFK